MKNTSTIDIAPVQLGALIKKKIDYRALSQNILPIVLFFIVWELIGRANQELNWFNPLFLPPPTLILMDGLALAQTGMITSSIISSTSRILVGFTLGCVIAVVMGVIMSRYTFVETWIAPIINLIGPIPALALLPLFIIWFGIGEFPKILLIAWSTFIPVLIYTLDGLKSVNSTLIRSALSLGANQKQIFTRVILPSAIPNILVGIEVSLGLSFSALVVSEMMGAENGLGYIIVDARNYFKISNMFVAIILIGLEYSLLAYMLKKLKNRILFWRKGGASAAIEK
ncbi:ABC transporter permease [Bacillus sp. CECT 9360]|uniref:ABC transporter permease n=1 Tax=Bacillus sp. CECT 9360 TaxID=2845821 RepID=UPI001E5D9B5F|nr:ABC transporter permease [Bacillus sp. CECT 9360]CAH0346263.1 Putative aliphatic sulfonates transport permease protein SsuC [Bacillus sp. CECT 9360]